MLKPWDHDIQWKRNYAIKKSAISLQRDQFDTKFQVEGDVPHQPFLHE